jgi:hypothetical protein
MHGSRSKVPSKKICTIYIYIYIYVKFLALLGAPYVYNISRLRVKTVHELDPEDGGTSLLQNVGNSLPVNTA